MATLEQTLKLTKENNRVCSLPQKWNQLYDMLPNKSRKGNGCEPSLPLILAAWDTPAISKMARLQEHIEWAAKQGVLEEVHNYLAALGEEEWHHIGE